MSISKPDRSSKVAGFGSPLRCQEHCASCIFMTIVSDEIQYRCIEGKSKHPTDWQMEVRDGSTSPVQLVFIIIIDMLSVMSSTKIASSIRIKRQPCRWVVYTDIGSVTLKAKPALESLVPLKPIVGYALIPPKCIECFAIA